MKRNRLIAGIIVVLIIVVIVIINTAGKESNFLIEVPVQKGHFEIVVSTTGELMAERSVEIRGPANLRNVRVHNVKITDIVPEGKLVQKGDYVATLDKTDATNRLQDLEVGLETEQSEYETTILDTTSTLRSERNSLVNLRYNVEEAEYKLEQSSFEPKATIRQNEHNLDKAKRSLEQAENNYELRVLQMVRRMKRAERELVEDRKRRDDLIDILKEFDIKAPQSGMVIYHREFGGKKRSVGSQITAWDPIVATLPDFSSMISTTYINEIDISKIAPNQNAVVSVDAFPDRKFTGKVISVANVGEQLPNSDAKVFEVVLKLNEMDTILRPAMTTMNSIVTKEFEDVLFVPLESIHHNDSLSFVYLSAKKVKKIVEMGEANDNEAIILNGLDENDIILLSVPEDTEEWTFEGWDLYEVLKEKRIQEEKQRLEDLERFKAEEEMRQAEFKRLQDSLGQQGSQNSRVMEGMRFEMDRGGRGRGRR